MIEKESASYCDLFSQFGKIVDGIFRDFPRVLIWQWELHHRKWGLRWLKHSETGILRQYKTMSMISAVFIDGIGPISDHHSIIPGSLNNNTREFLFWDDIWSQPCFVQCVKDMMRIWYDDMMKIFTSTMLGTDNWPSWLALKQTAWDGKSHGKSTGITMENEASMILNPDMVKFAPYFMETLSNTLWGQCDPCSFFRRKLILLLESSQWFPVGKIFKNYPVLHAKILYFSSIKMLYRPIPNSSIWKNWPKSKSVVFQCVKHSLNMES